MKWLLATHNQGKIRELRRILEGLPVSVQGLAETGIEEESPETGNSFMENALQKARFYWKLFGGPVLADDSGLEVDALNGAPGIHSSRFGGFPTHAEKCAYLLGLLSEVPPPSRSARFCCAAVYYDGKETITALGTLEGYIGQTPEGDGGFGYDPVFRVDLNGPTLAQISAEEKNKISHRAKAFRELIEGLKSKRRI
jgi:XTP/dITP diphosphohydrolase